MCKQQENIASAFISFFHSLMRPIELFPLDVDLINDGSILTTTRQNMSMTQFTPAEIKVVLFSMQDDKAPGLDGYSVGFYKDVWPIIGNYIT